MTGAKQNQDGTEFHPDSAWKNINKSFGGKLKVALSGEKQSILTISNEKGFDNGKFVLKKDLTSNISEIRYLRSNIAGSIKEAEQSVEDFYKKIKEEDMNVVNQQKEAVQKKKDRGRAKEESKEGK
jgi:hypothetical protein